MAAFEPASPQWTPRDFADTRAAWDGPLPDRPGMRVRVEAAAYRGRPISFYLIGPWSRATRMQPVQRTTLEAMKNGFFLVMLLVLFAGAALLARHNIRIGRGDRRGAARIAPLVMMTVIIVWAAVGHHVPDINLEFRLFVKAFQVGAGAALILWILYVAIEPFARRFWPDGLLGWTRLVAGYIRDPRVGRDVLVGALFSVAIMLTSLARLLLPGALGYPAVMPVTGREVSVLRSATSVIGVWGDAVLNAPAATFFAAMVFIVLRLALRRRWLAIVLGTAIVAVIETSNVATARWLDGFTLINGLQRRLVNPDGAPALTGPGRELAGVSGAAVWEHGRVQVAELCAWRKAGAWDRVVFAVGGITTVERARASLESGANAALVATAALADPLLAARFRGARVAAEVARRPRR